MRDDERFVGEAIAGFVGDGAPAAVLPSPTDPPDLYLELRRARIAVEVTRLSQETFTPASDRDRDVHIVSRERIGTPANRRSQDEVGIRIIEELNRKVGPMLPAGLALTLAFELPLLKPRAFHRALEAWLEKIGPSLVLEQEVEQVIEGCRVALHAFVNRDGRNRIAGILSSRDSHPDIGFNARRMLLDRIGTKWRLCRDRVCPPIWLGLLNDYWLATGETYLAAMTELQIEHGFERVFVVSHQGHVTELPVTRAAAAIAPTAADDRPLA